MSDSFPTFRANENGHITVVFSNFSGQLTVKDIVELKKYIDCPLPAQDPSPKVDHITSRFENEGDNLREEKLDVKPATFNDTSTVEEIAESESDDSEGSRAKSENRHAKKDLSVAFDDEIECEFGLSQQVQGRNERYWLR